MSIMDFLDDYIMGPLNVIDHLEGFFSGIRYGDMGHQFAIPRVDKGGPMSLNEAEDLLNGYGVAVYGRTHDASNMYFRVKNRQAAWAEYLLLHAGAELVGPSVDARNPGYMDRHEPGWMPTPWSESDGMGDGLAQQGSPPDATKDNGFKGLVDWWNNL